MVFQPLEQFELEIRSAFINVSEGTLVKANKIQLVLTKWLTDDFISINNEQIQTFIDFNNLGNYFICFLPNSILFYTVFIIILIILLFSCGNFLENNNNLEKVKTPIFFFKEKLYIFVLKMLKEQISNDREIQKFFPLLISIFTFILFANFLGLIPFNFTVTSHLLVTFSLSFMVFLGITIFGILFNREKFVLLFIPANVPKYLLDFLFVIEIVSYVSRTFSLAIRLFANMLSGHALMFILSGFISKTYKVFTFAFEIRFLLIFVVIAVSILEMGICFLQAYVFTILTIIYLNDSFSNAH